MEGLQNPSGATGTASPLSPVGGGHGYMGGRHRKSHKLRLVKKKTVRRMLARHGLKMRGGTQGAPSGAASAAAPVGGRRRRRTHRRRGMFHF
jgi:hypothetical protein